jgi:PAS domain S-box-containing protein
LIQPVEAKCDPSRAQPGQEPSTARLWRYALTSLIYFALYILVEKLTVNTQLSTGPSIWYPPAGFTFALLLGGGAEYLPVVILTLATSECINFGTPFFSSFGILGAVITGSGYTIGAALLRAKLHRTDSLHIVLRMAYYVVIALTATFFVALAGSASLAVTLNRGWSDYWQFTLYWWLGDGVALLCTAPFLLMLAFPQFRQSLGFLELSENGDQKTSLRTIHAGAQAVGILLIFAALFVSPLSHQSNLFYLFFLPVIWVALVHGLRGAVVATFALNVGLIALYPATVFTGDVIVKVHLLQLSIALAGIFLGASINERELVRTQLSRRTTYFEELILNNPIATVVHGASGEFQMCNPAFEKLFQFHSTELTGRLLDDIIAPKELNLEATTLTNRTAAGEHIQLITRRLRKDGTLLDVEARGVPLRVNGELLGVLALYEDLTERKRLENQIVQSGKLQAVGRLAGGVAHDFNNIIGVIQGYAELLLDRLPKETDLRDSAEEIIHSSKRATTLTKQLLAFSRKQVLELRIVDLNGIVRDFERMLSRLIPEDIEQVFLTADRLGPIKADKGEIEQIIMNLAVNARDAMPMGGTLTIETFDTIIDQSQASLYLGAKPRAYVVLSVADSGIGMDAETKALIFEPFFSTKDKDKNSGLGLATVYGIVHHSGGFITVESSPGAGSTFRVHLPRAEGEAEPAPDPQAPLESTAVAGGNETILLAEDEDALREMIRIGLERVGYTVLEARDGAEAIEVAQTHEGEIHLLLTDVIMPRLRGPHTAKYISFLRPEIRTIFMSGYTDGVVADNDFLQRDPVFLQKPFARPALLQKIREVLVSEATPAI